VAREAIADERGSYELAAIPPETSFEIGATAPGYVPSWVAASGSAGNPRATAGGTVDLALARGLMRSGRVVDQSGRGLAGACVRPAAAMFRTGSKVVHLSLSGHPGTLSVAADATGAFRLADLSPDAVTSFVVTLQGYEDGRFEVAPVAGSNQPEIVVRLSPIPKLVVLVSGEDGRATGGAAVAPVRELVPGLAPTQYDMGPPSLTDREGRATLSWRGSDRVLLAWGADLVPALLPVEPFAVLETAPLEVRLRAAAVIRGTVLDDAGQPAVGAEVRLHWLQLRIAGEPGKLVSPSFDEVVVDESETARLKWYLLPSDEAGLIPTPSTMTDSRGRFALAAGPRDGDLAVLRVEQSDCIPESVTWREGDPEAVVRTTRAAVVEIGAYAGGQETAVPWFTVFVRQEGHIVGRGNPSAGKPLRLELAPGRHSFRIRAQGFLELELGPVDLRAGETRTLRADLVAR
jgi:hypothetical protein